MGCQSNNLEQRDSFHAGLPWFAIRVKSNFEWKTAAILREKGFTEFVPTYKARIRWSDRLKETIKPLFPGYVFCRFDPDLRLPVIATPGVLHVVGHGKTPVPVEDREIESISATVRSGLLTMPWPFLRVGDRVRVEVGALAGIEGILVKIKNAYRLVISIILLQRSIAAEVDLESICPLRQRTASVPDSSLLTRFGPRRWTRRS